MTLSKFKHDVEIIAEGIKEETPNLSTLVEDFTDKKVYRRTVRQILVEPDELADRQIGDEESV